MNSQHMLLLGPRVLILAACPLRQHMASLVPLAMVRLPADGGD